jgi:pimeloyl-ACP methyl ester carboxylesterase
MTPIQTDLHVRLWGEGHPERVVLLHGSNVPDPERIWQQQRPLAEQYELVVVDRRGFGDSPSAEHITWESELNDLLALVGEHAHVVGHSFGGVLALLLGSTYPERVRSLVAIEPPAYGLVRDDPAVAARAARLASVHAAGPTLTAEEFLRRFVAALGDELPAEYLLEPRHRKGVDATRLSPDPATAPIVVERLAGAPFPKLVASGGWNLEMETICQQVAVRIGAERAVFPGTGHSPQQQGAAFNERLRAIFAEAAGR